MVAADEPRRLGSSREPPDRELLANSEPSVQAPGPIPIFTCRPAWLETLTMAPPRPSRIIDRDVYLVTSRAPRALMLITLSKTAMSVSIGVAISPPYPPQFTTP